MTSKFLLKLSLIICSSQLVACNSWLSLISVEDPNFQRCINDNSYFWQGAKDIGYLPCSQYNIHSIAGIEAFSSLHSIYLVDNELSEVDFTGNPVLARASIYGNQLKQLKLNNPKLIELNVSDNQLNQLDLSKSPELTSLHIQQNELTDLDLSAQTELGYLYASDNQISHLDLSANTQLTRVELNYNKINNINLKFCKNLEVLSMYYNQLESLDLSGNTELEFIEVSKNKLKSFKFTSNQLKPSIYAEKNLFDESTLARLDSFAGRAGTKVKYSQRTIPEEKETQPISIATSYSSFINSIKAKAKNSSRQGPLTTYTMPNSSAPQLIIGNNAWGDNQRTVFFDYTLQEPIQIEESINVIAKNLYTNNMYSSKELLSWLKSHITLEKLQSSSIVLFTSSSGKLEMEVQGNTSPKRVKFRLFNDNSP